MKEISRQIMDWYQASKRDLPWRQTTDPYHIWLSEVILQQTRVAQGLSYYHRFIEKFPTVKNLAEAPEDEVLGVWQGLGYYSRARNLHSAARHITGVLHGKFPGSYEGLLQLKGIGEYTAAAIASFAYHEDKAVVDGNVIRVVSRLYGIEGDVRLPKTIALIKEHTQALLPVGQAYMFNQGIMELGALVCVPRSPKCPQCPVTGFCAARRNGRQEAIPYKSKAKGRKVRYLNYLLLEADGALFFRKRGPKDIWEGLYEPILFEEKEVLADPTLFLQRMELKLDEVEIIAFSPAVKHILSHQELWVSLCHVRVKEIPKLSDGRWISISQLEELPKPVIFSKILNRKQPPQLPLVF